MPDYLVLLATLGGLTVFGLAGFVAGPVIAALFLVIVADVRRRVRAARLVRADAWRPRPGATPPSGPPPPTTRRRGRAEDPVRSSGRGPGRPAGVRTRNGGLPPGAARRLRTTGTQEIADPWHGGLSRRPASRFPGPHGPPDSASAPRSPSAHAGPVLPLLWRRHSPRPRAHPPALHADRPRRACGLLPGMLPVRVVRSRLARGGLMRRVVSAARSTAHDGAWAPRPIPVSLGGAEGGRSGRTTTSCRAPSSRSGMTAPSRGRPSRITSPPARDSSAGSWTVIA